MPTTEKRAIYVPRQHGAWALLAVPLLAGIAASRPVVLDAVLAVAAVAGYLFAATLASAMGARDRRPYRGSLVLFGVAAGVTAASVLAASLELVVGAVVVVPAAGVSASLALRRRSRALVSSLSSAAQAVVLAPSAAWLGGMHDPADLARLTFLAAVYVFGSVLAVRSVIRERSSVRFWIASVAAHLVAAAVAVFVLPLAAALLVVVLTVRAALLPAVARTLAARGGSLRPVFVGVGEGIAGIAVVVVALIVRL